MQTESTILSKLLNYENIVIQCHDNPDSDALASGLAVYKFLQSKGRDATLIYSGLNPIEKANVKYMISECAIPIRYVKEQSDIGMPDLLVTVDCQYGQSNVRKLDAKNIMMIDHHIQMVKDNELCDIRSDYQSCSTILYQLLLQEGYDVEHDELLKIAFYYGLYIDTSSFRDLFHQEDMDMKQQLNIDSPILTQLMNSTMNTMELMVACDALYNHYQDIENKFIIVSALKCDQSVLGIIGDFMIQVDICHLALTYTLNDMNYQFSIRCCDPAWSAPEVARFITKDIGSGGGHLTKAGGSISKTKFESLYSDQKILDYMNERLCSYIQSKKV